MTIQLIDSSFFDELEGDSIAAVGVSLSRNGKIVTARTVRSVRAATFFSGNTASILTYGGEGLPFIIRGKKAGTKYPVDFKGTETGPTGRERKVFELKSHLKDWKAKVGFQGSDFMLARTIAENPRAGVNIGLEAVNYLSQTVTPKILNKFSSLLAAEIVNTFSNE